MTNEQLTMKNAVSLPLGVCPPVSQGEKERAVFRSRRMFQTDMASDMATAEERGEKRGRLAIAQNMKEDGESIDKIIRYTCLTHDEVENLSTSTHHWDKAEGFPLYINPSDIGKTNQADFVRNKNLIGAWWHSQCPFGFFCYYGSYKEVFITCLWSLGSSWFIHQ
jgi:hypothetical protein